MKTQPFAVALRAARLRSGISQRTLARSMRISTVHLNHIEAGKSDATPPLAARAAQALDLNALALIEALLAERPSFRYAFGRHSDEHDRCIRRLVAAVEAGALKREVALDILSVLERVR